MTASPHHAATVRQNPAHAAPRASFWPGAAMAFFGTVLFILLAADIRFHGKLAQGDGFIARGLYQHMHGWMILLFAGITGMGQLALIASLTAAVAIWLIVQGRWRALAGWLLAMAGSSVICTALKDFFAVHRPRGFTTFVFTAGSGFSFPSGHTMSVAIFSGALMMVITHGRVLSRKRRIGLWLFVVGLSTLEALALVMIGVHYLTDVLGGLAISLAWLGVIRMILPPRLADPVFEEVHPEIDRGTNTATL